MLLSIDYEASQPPAVRALYAQLILVAELPVFLLYFLSGLLFLLFFLRIRFGILFLLLVPAHVAGSKRYVTVVDLKLFMDAAIKPAH